MNQLPEVTALESAARSALTPGWLERVEEIIGDIYVRSDVDAESVGKILREAIIEQKRLREETDKVKSKAYAVWKGMCDLENALTAPYGRIELRLRTALEIWQRDKERISRQQQDDIEKVAIASRQALQAAAREAAREGNIDQARRMRQEAELTSAPRLPSPTLNIPGVGSRTEYEIEVTDQLAFYRAIGAGTISPDAAPINVAWLKKKARDLNGLPDFPGLKVTPVKKLRVSVK